MIADRLKENADIGEERVHTPLKVRSLARGVRLGW